MTTTETKRDLVQRNTSLVAAQLDYILLDGSGSMIDKWDQTLAGLEGYFQTLRTAGLSSHGILQVFDSPNLEYIQRDSVIEHWPPFDRFNVDIPGGGTPLYDAVNIAVRNMAALDPERACLVIVTDGDSNGRQQTTADEARALLDWCRAKGWQVIFLGADFDNQRDAAKLGARKQEFIGVQKERLSEAGTALAKKRIRYAAGGDDIGFNDEEKTTFGGYLAAPK